MHKMINLIIFKTTYYFFKNCGFLIAWIKVFVLCYSYF